MRKMIGRVAAAALASLAGVAHAATGGDNQKVWDEAMAVARTGPADVALVGEAVLHLPAGEVFVPQPQADKLLNSFGNPGANPEMPGIILPRDPRATWIMPVRFHKSGYIKDDDARTWDADAMLRSLRTGTEEQNVERKKAGVPALEVVDWTDPPRYDSTTQRLTWSLASRVAGAKPDDPQTVNYNTYSLGRDGYFSMILLAQLSDLPALKPVADQQIAALEFDAGKRYADFNPGTDHVAGYGLVGLVVSAADRQESFVAQAVGFVHRNAALVIAGLAVLLVAVILPFTRKRKAAAVVRPKPPQDSPLFANTVAESPSGPPVAAVDLDLGDGPAGAPRGAA